MSNRPIVPPAVDAGWPPEHTALIAFQFVLQCRGSDLELTDLEASAANQPFGITEMLSTASAHGYQAWLQSCAWEHLVAVPFPALAELRDGSFLVLGAYAHDRVLLQDPARREHASALTRDRFLSLWSGRLVLVTTEAPGPGHE